MMSNFRYFLVFLYFFITTSLFAQERVWPGDVNNNGVVNEADLLFLGLGFGQSGPARKSVSSEWTAQDITDVWAVSAVAGLDLAFADCDGNGEINEDDVAVIVENFGRTHNDVVFMPDAIPAGIPGVSPSFAVSEEADLTIVPSDRQIDIPISLGSDILPVSTLKGISFYIKSNDRAFIVEQTTFEFDAEGWLPTDGAQRIQIPIRSNGRFPAVGDVVVAYTRTSGIINNGIGRIGSITVAPRPGFILEGDFPDLKISIDSIILIDELNNKVPVLGTEFNLIPTRVSDTTRVDSTICQGESVLFNENTITESGTYYDTLKNAVEGDSIIVLDLLVNDTFQTNQSGTICEGGSLLFNGQMLTESGIYRDTLTAANGCDSFIVFDFTVLPNFETQLTETICQGEQIAFGGNTYFESGTYRDTLTAVNGCDSVLIFNLTVNDTLQNLLTRTICAGDNFLFNDQTLTESGIYRDTFAAANGCNQYLVLDLTVAEEIQTNLAETICEGEAFVFDNQELRTAGMYSQTLSAASGCDSTVTLTLSVLPVKESTLNETICVGNTYDFMGSTIVESGTYSATLTGNNGCDSVVVLELTVADSAQTTINQTICEGANFNFNGQDLATAGIYRDTLATVNGCDSFIILVLKISDRYETEMNRVICEGESTTFNGRSISISGVYRDTFVAVNGCDSLVNLNLSVATISFSSSQAAICQGGSLNFNGQLLTEAGVYLDTMAGRSGCDSLVELRLSVDDPLESTSNLTICAGDTVNFYNFVLTTTNTYMVTLQTDDGCDSMVIMNLQVLDAVETTIDTTICPQDSLVFGGLTLATAGTYTQMMTSAKGCDSLVTLNLAIGTAGQGACTSVNVEEELLRTIEIYPNPVNQRLFINAPDVKMTDIRLVNLTGQVLLEQSFLLGNAPNQHELDLQNLTTGVYWVLIQTEQGLRQEKVVKL